MADADGTCEYVLDPDDPETWGGEEGEECYVDEDVLNDDGVWTCPHDAEKGEDLCIFHLPVDEKDDEETVDTFLDTLRQVTVDDTAGEDEQKLQFIDTQFGTFNLSSRQSDINVEEKSIILTHSNIEGELDWSDSSINMLNIVLVGATFEDRVDFSGSRFEGEVNFYDGTFNGTVKFNGTVFDGETIFTGCTFDETVHFHRTSFTENANFNSTKYKKSPQFTRIVCEGEARFEQTIFRENARFYDNIFKQKVSFVQANFHDNADFYRTAFNNVSFMYAEIKSDGNFKDAVINGTGDFNNVEFVGDADFGNVAFEANAYFDSVRFRQDVNFQNAEFGGVAHFGRKHAVKSGRNEIFEHAAKFEGDIDFRDVLFDKEAEFDEVVLRNGQFDRADLTDAIFTDAILIGSSFESSLLSRATLFGTDLRGAKLSGAVLGDVRIDDDTKFLGHPSDYTGISPHTISAITSQPTCVYDPDYEDDNEHADLDKANSVYRALEELGGKHARPRLQARSFVRRQDLQKQDYWNDATADDASLEERLIAGARWSRAKIARATLLYGESPWRVIIWSLGIIFSFALLYPLGGWMKPTDGDPITYAQIASNPAEILNSVYYSTLTYTALGFGDFQPVGLGRLLTTLETGLGAVMLALLVFILGRRAAR